MQKSPPDGLALWQIQCVGRWGGNTVEQYVAEAFVEIRAASLWEVSEELRGLLAAVEDITGLRAELKHKAGSSAVPNAICQETVERDLVDEALRGHIRDFSGEHRKAQHRRSRIHVVNRRTNVVHACGWKFGSTDARPQAGAMDFVCMCVKPQMCLCVCVTKCVC